MATASNHRGGNYLFRVLGKAWKEFQFIELLSEACGGLVLAAFAYYKGWIGQEGALELVLECVGCALLVPLIAFILRAIFVAPAELVKETEEAKKKIEVDPKSISPSITTTLLGICAFLIVCLGFSIKFNFEKIGGKPGATEARKTEPPKPLPDKIIPAPPAPLTNVVAQNPAPTATVTQRNEVFNAATEDDADDPVSKFSRIQEQRAEAERIANQRTRDGAAVWWRKFLPFYQRALVELHDALKREADKKGDGLVQTAGYFQCLPSDVDFDTGQFDVATIGLRNDTNMNFTISVTKRDEANNRQLHISCSGGTSTINPGWLGQNDPFINMVHSNPTQKTPAFDYTDECKFTNDASVCTGNAIRAIISLQHRFLREGKK